MHIRIGFATHLHFKSAPRAFESCGVFAFQGCRAFVFWASVPVRRGEVSDKVHL